MLPCSTISTTQDASSRALLAVGDDCYLRPALTVFPISCSNSSQFSPTGTLQFGQSLKGRDAIKGFRESMVHATNGPVVDLQHTLDKCFVLTGDAGQGKEEVTVNGSIWYRLKNGRKVDCDFSSWMKFSEQEGLMLADYYEVYLDAHELMTAIGEMNAAEGK